MPKDREACGRCSLSVAVDVSSGDHDEDERAERNPYGENRIEVDEASLRIVSPAAWFSRLTARLNDAVTRLTWNR
ncbi:hypothetical protein [Natronolimnohabitans innermongolicus]|uniref:Uncharacterized protein n=1 Tax=Natronolimnohabitans innermongolicus JCM 12255 TaxID=1227499 RepID=L9WSW3_9EURY|nr:hypothetical protein [Natronolimnohabitans innermongolicus]ELY52559.1 hypothetical protein C493_15960 [Natronolimnohabitans innermongolicus JCM 12255]